MEFLVLLGTPLLGALTFGLFGGAALGTGGECGLLAGHLPRRLCTHVEDRGTRQPVGRARAILH